jgi:predicted amidohydrolase YtcJ
VNSSDGFTLPITIFAAREIVTMNPSNPSATHVAVRDGRILGVGALDELTPWGPHSLDTTFADHVLVPGFVEAHSHILEGALWAFPFVGRFDRYGPDGALHPGSPTVESLIGRLRELDAAMPSNDDPLVCWGFDPIYYDGVRISKIELDSVSTTRPIVLVHASLHLATGTCAHHSLNS